MFQRDSHFFGIGLYTPDDIARELNGITFLAGRTAGRQEPDPAYIQGVSDTLNAIAIHFGLRIVADDQKRS